MSVIDAHKDEVERFLTEAKFRAALVSQDPGPNRAVSELYAAAPSDMVDDLFEDLGYRAEDVGTSRISFGMVKEEDGIRHVARYDEGATVDIHLSSAPFDKDGPTRISRCEDCGRRI